MKILVISCSLNPKSKSKTLADAACEAARAAGAGSELVCLSKHPLPMCDGGASFQDPAVLAMTERIKAADAVILSSPVYTYYVNAAAKNLIELTGPGWEDKIVGLMVSAGGSTSFMAPMTLASQLMLDFRCVVIPRFVYGGPEGFEDGKITPKLQERVGKLAREAVRFAKGLRKSD